MALAPVQLDTLTWDQMTTAIRGRIAALSGNEWTLHAPVDPGVTLLDLFAARLEERLFWMDQPSESTQRALLRLLGIQPKAAVAATTVVVFTSRPDALPQTVEAQTLLHLEETGSGTSRRRIFTTSQPFTFVPAIFERPGRPDLPGTIARVDLETTRGPVPIGGGGAAETCLFQRVGSQREARLTLWLEKELTSEMAGGVLSLLFDLAMPSGLHAQWSTEAVDATPPASLRWSFANADGTENPIDDAGASVGSQIDDGTGGLRRSGIVQLPIPDPVESWTPRTEGDPARFGYQIVITLESGAYTFSPRIRRVLPNAVIASHRRPASVNAAELERQMEGWARRPGDPRVLRLPEQERPPLVDLETGTDENGCGESAAESNGDANSFTLKIREDDAWIDWTPTDDLAFAGPADRRLVVDRTHGVLRFGDGLTGRLPLGSEGDDEVAVQLKYEVGGGIEGNLGAMRWWRFGRPGERCAFNAVPAGGGAEDEAVAAAIDRARSEITRVRRTVTGSDFEALAMRTPGVSIARARAAIGRHPDLPCITAPGAITVYVVPGLPRSLMNDADSCGDDLTALRSDNAALEAVRRHLDKARLITQEVFVRQAIYTEFDLRVEIEGSGAVAPTLRRRIERTLRTFLHPLAGDSGAGWPFGEPVRPSSLMRAVQVALGEEYIVASIGIRMRGAPSFDACSDAEIAEHALPALRGVEVRTTKDQRDFPETLR